MQNGPIYYRKGHGLDTWFEPNAPRQEAFVIARSMTLTRSSQLTLQSLSAAQQPGLYGPGGICSEMS